LTEANRSNLGVRVQIKFVVDISVRWSISLWVSVLYLCVKAVICSLGQLKETIMTIQNAIVLVGAALLPAWTWDAPPAQGCDYECDVIARRGASRRGSNPLPGINGST
jgi:hypothetical protein